MGTLGERLTMLRKTKNLTQQEVANIMYCKREAITYYENDTRQPKIDDIVIFSQIYNVSTDYLLGVTEISNADPDIKMIGDYTGLNEKSIKFLHKWLKSNKRELKIINTLIGNDYGRKTLSDIGEYFDFNLTSLPSDLYFNESRNAVISIISDKTDKTAKVPDINEIGDIGEPPELPPDITELMELEAEGSSFTLSKMDFEQLIFNRIINHLKNVKELDKPFDIYDFYEKHELELKKLMSEAKEKTITPDEYWERYISILKNEFADKDYYMTSL